MCVEILFVTFKGSNRTNYSIEVLTLLAQYHLILPPCVAEQLEWSRFVNIHGLPGHNINCDLHMEHLNRIAKDAIKGLGANKSAKAIDRVGKVIGTISMSLTNFDKANSVKVDQRKRSPQDHQPISEKIGFWCDAWKEA